MSLLSLMRWDHRAVYGSNVVWSQFSTTHPGRSCSERHAAIGATPATWPRTLVALEFQIMRLFEVGLLMGQRGGARKQGAPPPQSGG